MKGKLKLFTLVIGLLILTTGCMFKFLPEQMTIVELSGTGELVTREETFTGFDKLSISQSFDVEVVQGDRFKIIMRVDEEAEEYLEVTKRGETLKIGLDPDNSYTTGNVVMEATITMPILTGLHLSGASQASITGFESGKDFELDLSGASNVRGDIRAGNGHFKLSGSSEAELAGSAANLSLNASGSSTADLARFLVEDADVDVSGATEITVNVSDSLNVKGSGASQVEYVGNPRLSIDTSGIASVERK